jgi:hypothetical protein
MEETFANTDKTGMIDIENLQAETNKLRVGFADMFPVSVSLRNTTLLSSPCSGGALVACRSAKITQRCLIIGNRRVGSGLSIPTLCNSPVEQK